jgi:hypothetical protein
MSGVLDLSTIEDLQYYDCFVANCLSLLGEAYKYINVNSDISVDWEEENISANLFKYIDESERAIGLNINISDEHRLYYQKILSGTKAAKTASRIDFRLTTNWTEKKKRFEFFIEAKNLIENPCFKKGRKTKLNAKKLHERYIETGIDKYLSGKYPQRGCLVGYVLEGKSINIAKQINSVLLEQNRSAESLVGKTCLIDNISYHFLSSHPNSLNLEHYFIEFS